MNRLPLLAIAVCAVLACSKGDASPRTGGTATPAAAPAHDSIADAADHGRILAKESATVWFLIVSDFQCPFCKIWHDSTFRVIEKEYVETGKLRMAYINYPIPQLHANAWPAAITAMCASAQGKFWETHESIFRTQNAWKGLKEARVYLDSLAVAAGADAAKLRSCEDEKRVVPLIEADQARFQGAGVQSTPTFFVGNAQILGALPTKDFRRVIDSVLAAGNKGK